MHTKRVLFSVLKEVENFLAKKKKNCSFDLDPREAKKSLIIFTKGLVFCNKLTIPYVYSGVSHVDQSHIQLITKRIF